MVIIFNDDFPQEDQEQPIEADADGIDYDNLVREQEDADAWANSL